MNRGQLSIVETGEPRPFAQPRECGECTACCTVMAVHELQKANYEACCHLGDRCSIYVTRPHSCREWSCLWLTGDIAGDERQRPNQLGLVFGLDERAASPTLTAYEVWPAASTEPEAKRVLDRLLQSWNIVLVDPQSQFVTLSAEPAIGLPITAPAIDAVPAA